MLGCANSFPTMRSPPPAASKSFVRKRAADGLAEQRSVAGSAERQQAFREARENYFSMMNDQLRPARRGVRSPPRGFTSGASIRLPSRGAGARQGRGVGAVVGAVLGERRAHRGRRAADRRSAARRSGGAQRHAASDGARRARGRVLDHGGRAVVVLKAAGAEAVEAWIDVLSEEAPPPGGGAAAIRVAAQAAARVQALTMRATLCCTAASTARSSASCAPT